MLRLRQQLPLLIVATSTALALAQLEVARANDCDFVAAGIPASDSTPFKPWQWEKNDLTIEAKDMLPNDFIQALTDRFGALNVTQIPTPKEGGKYFEFFAGTTFVAKFELRRNSDFPGMLVVEDLTLTNPLRAKAGELNADQQSAGMPPNVFRHAREQLKKLAVAGGFDSIGSVTQQNFIVMQLYRRAVGMSPAGNTSYHQHLDRLYQYARREMPAEFRPKDIQEFSAQLGTGSTSFSVPFEISRRWSAYIQRGEIAAGMVPLRTASGTLMGIVFNAGTPQQRIFYATPFDAGPVRPIAWRSLQEKNLTAMRLQL